MKRGKQTCKILKEIRKQIAVENDIKLVIEECTYQGDCLGTCPKCEAEVRYLGRELEKRQRMGKAAIFAGMTIGTAITAAGCGLLVQPPNGMLEEPLNPITTTDTIRNDSVEEPFLLEGDVVASEPDGIKETVCKNEKKLEVLGKTTEDKGIDKNFVYASDTTEVYVAPEVGYVVPFGQESDLEDDVYMIVEQMPEFPGGNEALTKYVADHVIYPEEAKKAGRQGRVFVGFIVEPDGSLSDFKVLRGIGYGCDEEAVRIAQSMPKWNPGMQRGEAVRVHYLFPVVFSLD